MAVGCGSAGPALLHTEVFALDENHRAHVKEYTVQKKSVNPVHAMYLGVDAKSLDAGILLMVLRWKQRKPAAISGNWLRITAHN